MFDNWCPITLEPYGSNTWYQVRGSDIAIRRINHCGEILEALATATYIEDLLGVDVRSAAPDVLEHSVCGLLMDEKILFSVVGVFEGVKH